MFFVFGILAIYTVLNRSGLIARIWLHPVFVASYILLCLGFLIESVSPFSRFSDLVSIGLMIVGAVLVATLCRDREALSTCIYTYVVVGIGISSYLFLVGFGALQRPTMTDFHEASQVRIAVYGNNALHGNMNSIAVYTTQGAVVALALGLMASSVGRRNVLFGITLLCLLGTSSTLSRGGIGNGILSCATVALAYVAAYGMKDFRRVIRISVMVICLGVGILMLVPDIVYSRLEFSTHLSGGQMEGRARVYMATIEHFSEYWMSGVGAGNFWGPWGRHTSFYSNSGMSGAHNSFIQVMIYWGLPGVLALIIIVYQAYRCLPKHSGVDTLSLCLLGIGVSLLVMLMVRHNLYAKELSLGLGLLVGARCWIWPREILRSGLQQQSHFPLSSKYGS